MSRHRRFTPPGLSSQVIVRTVAQTMLAVDSPLAATRRRLAQDTEGARLHARGRRPALADHHPLLVLGQGRNGPLLDDVHAIISAASFRADSGDDRTRVLGSWTGAAGGRRSRSWCSSRSTTTA